MLRSLKRITPAYAGKRERFDLFSAGIWDHPRLCGEKYEILAEKARVRGSPPPMRGKVDNVGVMCYNLRITPAYAGKSFFFGLCFGDSGDHPRLCGEKVNTP